MYKQSEHKGYRKYLFNYSIEGSEVQTKASAQYHQHQLVHLPKK